MRTQCGDNDAAPPTQSNSAWMSAAVIAPDSKPPPSMTLAKSLAFFCFKAMTFSSSVSFATNR